MPEKKKPDDSEEFVGEENGFREGGEHEELPEEVEHRMHVGGAEVDVYSEEGREELMENDEVTELEEGFAKGEENPELAHCAACGKVLSQDESKIVEREVQNETRLFCSDKCAQTGVQHGKKK
jgi:endogenous inhibitor of DNA gyrase (YacG/DUF329 family)